MRYLKSVLFIKNALLARGVLSYLKQFVPEHTVEVFNKTLYNLEAEPGILFIEREMLSDPPEFSLMQLKKNYPGCSIIMLSAKLPEDILRPYLDEFLLYTDPEKIVCNKIEHIYSGISEEQDTDGRNSVISDREREVLRQVALGLTNKEISEILTISTHTVITHRKNITAKLGIKTIAGLAVYAVLNGIISADELNKKIKF